jgi:hypothetical protein
MRKDFLRSMLAQESRAYGFTLAFWGSGALLIDNFGMPLLNEILLYTGGAIAGFGFLTLLAFRQAFSTVENEETQYLVFSMVHFLSALAPILITSYLVQLRAAYAFFLAGLSVSVVYNLMMLVEDRLSRHAMRLERKLVKL